MRIRHSARARRAAPRARSRQPGPSSSSRQRFPPGAIDGALETAHAVARAGARARSSRPRSGSAQARRRLARRRGRSRCASCAPRAAAPAGARARWSCARPTARALRPRSSAGTAESAREALSASIERQAPALGVAPKALAVRDQRTRWGSCSTRGTLSFSWRLLLAPAWVLDDVVCHELCHMRVLEPLAARSGRCFASTAPASDSRPWLRAHGGELATYRPGR